MERKKTPPKSTPGKSKVKDKDKKSFTPKKTKSQGLLEMNSLISSPREYLEHENSHQSSDQRKRSSQTSLVSRLTGIPDEAGNPESSRSRERDERDASELNVNLVPGSNINVNLSPPRSENDQYNFSLGSPLHITVNTHISPISGESSRFIYSNASQSISPNVVDFQKSDYTESQREKCIAPKKSPGKKGNSGTRAFLLSCHDSSIRDSNSDRESKVSVSAEAECSEWLNTSPPKNSYIADRPALRQWSINKNPPVPMPVSLPEKPNPLALPVPDLPDENEEIEHYYETIDSLDSFKLKCGSDSWDEDEKKYETEIAKNKPRSYLKFKRPQPKSEDPKKSRNASESHVKLQRSYSDRRRTHSDRRDNNTNASDIQERFRNFNALATAPIDRSTGAIRKPDQLCDSNEAVGDSNASRRGDFYSFSDLNEGLCTYSILESDNDTNLPFNYHQNEDNQLLKRDRISPSSSNHSMPPHSSGVMYLTKTFNDLSKSSKAHNPPRSSDTDSSNLLQWIPRARLFRDQSSQTDVSDVSISRRTTHSAGNICRTVSEQQTERRAPTSVDDLRICQSSQNMPNTRSRSDSRNRNCKKSDNAPIIDYPPEPEKDYDDFEPQKSAAVLVSPNPKYKKNSSEHGNTHRSAGESVTCTIRNDASNTNEEPYASLVRLPSEGYSRMNFQEHHKVLGNSTYIPMKIGSVLRSQNKGDTIRQTEDMENNANRSCGRNNSLASCGATPFNTPTTRHFSTVTISNIDEIPTASSGIINSSSSQQSSKSSSMSGISSGTSANVVSSTDAEAIEAIDEASLPEASRTITNTLISEDTGQNTDVVMGAAALPVDQNTSRRRRRSAREIYAQIRRNLQSALNSWGNEGWICEFCEIMFRRRDTYELHMRSQHQSKTK